MAEAAGLTDQTAELKPRGKGEGERGEARGDVEDLGTTGEGRQGGVEDWGGETGLNWATARLKGDRQRFVDGDRVGIGRAGDIKSFRCMGRVGICRGGGGRAAASQNGERPKPEGENY